MAIEAATRVRGRRRLFPACVLAGWNKIGPLLFFYVVIILFTNLRAIADERGLAVRRDFNGVEDILLHAAPNRLLQTLFLDVVPLHYLATGIYFSWMLMPLIAGLPLLFNRRPHEYWHLIAFMLLVQFSAAPFFFLYPLEPPWLHHSDIAHVQNLVFASASSKDNNLYAAMPSLHVTIPVAAALWYGLSDRYGKLLLGYAGLILVVVIYTGDHYVLDGVAGVALAGAMYGLVRLVRLPIVPRRSATAAGPGAAAAARFVASERPRKAA